MSKKMAMREFHRSLLIAPSKAGKTTLLKAFVRQRNNGSEFIFVADIHRIYSCEWRFYSAAEMRKHFAGKFRPGVYCCSFGDVEDEPAEWEEFFDIVDSVSGLSEKEKNQNTTLIFDEVVEFTNSADTTVPGVKKIIRYSRFAEIDVYYATMRPLGLHPLISINTDRLILFRQNRRKDLRAIIEISSISDRDAERVSALERFEWSPLAPVPVRGKNYLVFPEDSISDFQSKEAPGISPPNSGEAGIS